MSKPSLEAEVLDLVAHRFKVLAEPARLAILTSLRTRELTVSAIVDATGFGQGNVSKHLQLLHSHGFITRRKDGLYVYYALADRRVFTLCDLMCDSLQDVANSRRKLLAS